MTEIELKVVLDEDGVARLKARLKALDLADPAARPRALHGIYHDAPDHRLAAAGMALRLRKEGRRWIQTAKARPALSGGLARVEESEAPAPGGRLDLSALPDPDLAARMSAVLDGAPLQPVCETAIRRLALDLPLACGGRAELALDQGEIRAGEIALPFREAELELKAGRAADLYLLARDLFADGGVEFSTMTKAARGYMLAETGRIAPPIAPRTARRVEIAPDQSSETAARDILRECFDQVATNVLATRRIDDPEGPHQLRVGLRRLRSALSALRPVVGGAESARLGDEARWLGQEAGRLRDLDVALADILAPEIAAHPGEPGFPTLRAAVAARRDRVRADLRAVLDGGRVTAFQLDLARFVETRGWLDPADYGQTDRLSRPAAEMAREALDRRWKKVTKRARDIETLDIPARHELRKELKKLRYAVEFMAPLYAEKKVRAFLKRLKRLQDVFGALNDAAMAEALFVGAEAPGAGDPDAQRAAGRVLGARAERAETQWHEARALWRALAEAGPFWR